MFEATTSGGRQAKHAVLPGSRYWMWPEIAFSLTPDSIHIWFSSQAAYICKTLLGIQSSCTAFGRLHLRLHLGSNVYIGTKMPAIYRVDRHPCLEIVDTAEENIDSLPVKPAKSE